MSIFIFRGVIKIENEEINEINKEKSNEKRYYRNS